jgi:hypothetical protein
MSRSTGLATAGLVALLAGCADQQTPTAPGPDGLVRSNVQAQEQERMERLARNFALALDDSGFRSTIRRSLEQSPFGEHKVYFQGMLTASNRRMLRSMAQASGSSEREIEGDAAGVVGLEFYLPVPEHRFRWSGDAGILVATAREDGDIPIAFDTRGHRYQLDPRQPPSIPVIALEPVETDFSRPPLVSGDAKCADCAPPPGGSPPPPPPPPPPSSPPAGGLFMTYAHVNSGFESWLKGNPEYEVHILGQLGTTDSLLSYQCAGEHAGGAYAYDQNDTSWTGTVLLFSQAQLDGYKAAHPGQSIRIFLVEDDDAVCEIRSGNDTFEDVMQLLDTTYVRLTGARDTTSGTIRVIKGARSLQKLLTLVTHLINTNDEMVGNAIEDAVAGISYPGANWIVKGENNVTNGWLKLEMR